MKTPIGITDLVRNFSDYINRVAYKGESFSIKKGRNVVAELRPLPQGRKLAELSDMLQSLPALSPKELVSFNRDLKSARRDLPKRERDVWES